MNDLGASYRIATALSQAALRGAAAMG